MKTYIDIFKEGDALNVFSLHLDKELAHQVYDKSTEVIGVLKHRQWLSEKEHNNLRMAENSLNRAKCQIDVIDNHLKKFLN